MQNPNIVRPIWASLRAMGKGYKSKILYLTEGLKIKDEFEQRMHFRCALKAIPHYGEMYDELLYRYFRRFGDRVTIERGLEVAKLAQKHTEIGKHHHKSDLLGLGGFVCLTSSFGDKFVARQLNFNRVFQNLSKTVSYSNYLWAQKKLGKIKSESTTWEVEIERISLTISREIKKIKGFNRKILEK